MKYMHMAMVVALSLCVEPALAGATFEAATLGQMKAVLDGCTATNPREASSYLLHMKDVIGSATKAMVDEAEQTEDYRQAYDSIRTQLNDMTQEKRVAACESYLSAR